MEAWPFESTKRSRSHQYGLPGLNLSTSRHSTSAMSAIPIAAPGWPELAFWTASMARARMALASSRRVGQADFLFKKWDGGPAARANRDVGRGMTTEHVHTNVVCLCITPERAAMTQFTVVRGDLCYHFELCKFYKSPTHTCMAAPPAVCAE